MSALKEKQMEGKHKNIYASCFPPPSHPSSGRQNDSKYHSCRRFSSSVDKFRTITEMVERERRAREGQKDRQRW